MPAQPQSFSRFCRITDDDTTRTKILKEKGSVLAISVSIPNFRPLFYPRLRPGAVSTPRGIDTALLGFTAHAFKTDIAPSFGRNNHEGVTNHTIDTYAQRGNIDKKAIFRGRTHVKRQ